MKQTRTLTDGSIVHSLLAFAFPVLLALLLQALYGGVDLLVVGHFAQTTDVSGVATGSLLLQTVTMIITGLAMGITILVGEAIGCRQPRQAGQAIGGGICLFAVFGLLLTVFMVGGAEQLVVLLHAPQEALTQTTQYIRICGGGALFIVAYNVLGSVFRGIGDAKTPLLTVMIACIINIVGDILFVAVFSMGAAGAALATVIAQGVSVLVSFLFIARKPLPFSFSWRDLKFQKKIISKEIRLGTPVALQECLVGISFLVIQTIVNSFGVVASAGVGVAEKVCVFMMLVPSAYMQSMSAFVAQNMGANNPVRAKKALAWGMGTALLAGLIMAYAAFFHGDILSSLLTGNSGVIAASHSYLKAYAIDCTLTPILFCLIGYYNGREKTVFVMFQGMVGAFLIRVPLAYFISREAGATLFQIGLATPASSVVQILLCLILFFSMEHRERTLRLRSLGKNK